MNIQEGVYHKYSFALDIYILCVTFNFSENKLRDVEWFEEGQKSLGNLLKNYINTGIAKNVIVFIGDGMGISTMTAARLLKAQQQNRSLFETRLAWEEFPNSAIVLVSSSINTYLCSCNLQCMVYEMIYKNTS